MGKGIIKRKTKNPGVGVDFKRVKHKVGKKLPRARNETDTDFKSRSINLPNQAALREDRSEAAVNYQNLTLKVCNLDVMCSAPIQRSREAVAAESALGDVYMG